MKKNFTIFFFLIVAVFAAEKKEVASRIEAVIVLPSTNDNNNRSFALLERDDISASCSIWSPRKGKGYQKECVIPLELTSNPTYRGAVGKVRDNTVLAVGQTSTLSTFSLREKTGLLKGTRWANTETSVAKLNNRILAIAFDEEHAFWFSLKPRDDKSAPYGLGSIDVSSNSKRKPMVELSSEALARLFPAYEEHGISHMVFSPDKNTYIGGSNNGNNFEITVIRNLNSKGDDAQVLYTLPLSQSSLFSACAYLLRTHNKDEMTDDARNALELLTTSQSGIDDARSCGKFLLQKDIQQGEDEMIRYTCSTINSSGAIKDSSNFQVPSSAQVFLSEDGVFLFDAGVVAKLISLGDKLDPVVGKTRSLSVSSASQSSTSSIRTLGDLLHSHSVKLRPRTKETDPVVRSKSDPYPGAYEEDDNE